MPMLWWVELSLFPLMGSASSGGVFWGVCELSTTLGSLSADGWCCVPVLLVVWHEVSGTEACRQLGGNRSWCQDGTSGRAHSNQCSLGPGILWQSSILDSVLLSWRPRPDPRLGNQEPASCAAWAEKKERKGKERKEKKINKTQDK